MRHEYMLLAATRTIDRSLPASTRSSAACFHQVKKKKKKSSASSSSSSLHFLQETRTLTVNSTFSGRTLRFMATAASGKRGSAAAAAVVTAAVVAACRGRLGRLEAPERFLASKKIDKKGG